MVSNNLRSSTILLLSIITFSFFTLPSDAQSSSQSSVAIGIDNEGLFIYALSVAVSVRPNSNLQSRPLFLNRDSVDASKCSGIVPDIRACQSQGVKVFLSLTGSYPDTLLSPQQVSDYLWNTFLGGHSIFRPFGDVVFDGINFDIEAGSGQFWADLATSLKARSSSISLSATVPCLFPNAYLGSAIEAGLFNYIWVRFYNNPQCEYGANADALLATWNQWTQVNSSRILLGLPAAPGAARSGYIPPNVLISSVLPYIKTSPKYGGVILWDTFYDQQTGYSAAIKNSV